MRRTDAREGRERAKCSKRTNRKGRRRTPRRIHQTRSLTLESLEGRSLFSVSALLLSAVEIAEDDLAICELVALRVDSDRLTGRGPQDNTTDSESFSEPRPEATAAIESNASPVANDDFYSMVDSQQLGAGVLTNDSDIDGDSLTVRVDIRPEHGQLDMQPNGLFTYKPDFESNGRDSFTYIVSDGQYESNAATATISVAPVPSRIESVNEAPIATDDAYAVSEDDVLVVEATGVLANDADADGDALTVTLASAPANGTVTLTDDGSFQYTPKANFHGEDSFTYMANDGQSDGNLATVSIVVERIDVNFSLEVSLAAFGENAEAVWNGTSFWVNVYVNDDRDEPLGVVGGVVDILFDRWKVVPTGHKAFGEDFSSFQQGVVDIEAGVVDEAGAIAMRPSVGVDGFAPFLAWEFVSTAPLGEGHIRDILFAIEPGEGTEGIHPPDFALTGQGTPVDWAQVKMNSAEVDVFDADFNGDQAVDHFDLALWLPHGGSSSDNAAYDPSFDLNGDRLVNDEDLTLLTAAMYRPVTSVVESHDQPTGPTSETLKESGDNGFHDEFLCAVDDYFSKAVV